MRMMRVTRMWEEGRSARCDQIAARQLKSNGIGVFARDLSGESGGWLALALSTRREN